MASGSGSSTKPEPKTSDKLLIGGKQMPPFSEITITPEKIWSKNTGRGADGKMQGDIVAVKMKLQIKFNVLTAQQKKILDDAIKPAFFTVKYKEPSDSTYHEKTMYAGTPTYPVYSYVNGYPDYVGVGVDLIER